MEGTSADLSHVRNHADIPQEGITWNPMPTRGPCSRCKGEGVIDCETCHNDGDDSRGCAACDDEGTTTCGACKGTKVTVYYSDEEGDDDDDAMG